MPVSVFEDIVLNITFYNIESFQESCHVGEDATYSVFQTSAAKRKLHAHGTVGLLM